jgi:hypothetical protein
MNKSSILICTLALSYLQACAGHSIDLDQGASSAPSGTDLVGVEVTRVPDSISYLGTDDARVYWTTGDEGDILASSVAQSCVFDQCNSTRVSYGPMRDPLTIGVQDVFFLADPATPPTYPFGREVGCPKAGCGAAPNEIFEDTTLPINVAVDDRYFYWSSTLDIYRCLLTGGGEVPEVVAKGETTNSGLIVDGDTVFWTLPADTRDLNGDSQIHSAPKDGSRPPTLIANGVRVGSRVPFPNFTVDATKVYWVDGSSHVQSCPRTGCDGQAPVTLVTTEGAKQTLRVDATGIYWLGGLSSDEDVQVDLSIRFCPLTGCAQDADVRVLTPNKVGQFAMSSKYLYWDEPWVRLENGTYINGDNRQIFRLAKPE